MMDLVGHFRIRRASVSDAELCQNLARPYFGDQLPFIALPQLRGSAEKGELFLAEYNQELVGFVRWHARRDSWNTLYDLVVREDVRQSGVGRNLLYAVPAPVQLKCPLDNDANNFYVKAGMFWNGVEHTQSGRLLLRYERRVLTQLVAGGNKQFALVARQSGMAYGTRHDYVPHDYPFALDIHYSHYDWNDYIEKVSQWKPVQALVADYQHPSQRQLMLDQVQDLRNAGVLRIIVCVKFPGAIRDVPGDCIIGLSMPTKKKGDYSGYNIPMEDMSLLRGRKAHLLGGSPQTQKKWVAWIAAAGGRVISTDGNSHESASKKGTFFLNGRWYNPSSDKRKLMSEWLFEGQDRNYKTMALSGRLINLELNHPAREQERPPEQLVLL